MSTNLSWTLIYNTLSNFTFYHSTTFNKIFPFVIIFCTLQMKYRSQDSSISVPTGYKLDGWVWIPAVARFSFLGPTRPPIQWHGGSNFLGGRIKQQEHEADISPPYNAKVKNGRAMTSLPMSLWHWPYLIQNRDNIPFHFYKLKMLVLYHFTSWDKILINLCMNYMQPVCKDWPHQIREGQAQPNSLVWFTGDLPGCSSKWKLCSYMFLTSQPCLLSN